MDKETKDMLQAILTTVGSIEARVGSIETRVGSIETRVGSIETRFDSLETRFDSLETRFDSIETKFNAMEQDLSDVKRLATKTAIIQENDISKKIQLIYDNQVNIIEQNKKFDKHENRIENLENDVFALKYAFKSLN